jgi:3-methyladenine DNA glycosylase/8-oxoguanine DNA glycosylase
VSERIWDAGRPVDVIATLLPLRRGRADPAHRIDAAGRFWWACATPCGPGSISLAAHGPQVSATAWGDGAQWLLDRVPQLLGEQDDWSALDLSREARLHEVWRRHRGMRLPRTALVLDSLVPAVLEQKVTGTEAHRSWRLLLQRFGTPAPGPEPMRVPPSARVLLDIPSWEWHRLGVDVKRQRTIRAVATVANRLEECVSMTASDALARLRTVPGVGEWTAAETAQRALGDPDAVSVGDYHLANWVVHFLTGAARGSDAKLVALLEPWRGQRQRVVRLIELSGLGAPRFGPRFVPLVTLDK